MTDDTAPGAPVGQRTLRHTHRRWLCKPGQPGTHEAGGVGNQGGQSAEHAVRGWSAVDEHSRPDAVALAEARGVLGQVAWLLPQARWELSRMRLDVLDADLRLRLGTGLQVDRLTPGEAIRGVITSTQTAVTAGGRVERRLREAVAGVKAAGVLLDGPAAVDTQDQLDTIRLRRQLSTLQGDLEAAQSLLVHSTGALRQVAKLVRRAYPPGAWTVQDLRLQQFTGRVEAAQEQTRHVDQRLDRAQVLTDQICTQMDTPAQSARKRMCTHRDRSPSASAPPTAVPR